MKILALDQTKPHNYEKIKIALVGGPDLNARLDLMQSLSQDFLLVAIGSSHTIAPNFAKAGFSYWHYPLDSDINPINEIAILIYLVKLFREIKPDLVHTFDTKPGVWARLAARYAGVPVIVGTLPGLGSLYNENITLGIRAIRSIYQPLQKLACHVSDLTVFQNHDDLEQFRTSGIVDVHKATVITGSGVNTHKFSRTMFCNEELLNLRAELQIADDAIVVTMISRLLHSKGVMDFIDACKIIGNYPKIVFVLVGPKTENAIDSLTREELVSIDKYIKYIGPRNDIPVILAMSDVFVLPSYYREGIPRVLLEAAAMGLPLVTTNSPGCREVVQHNENGFLVPVRAPKELAKAIKYLIEQSEVRKQFGEKSRKLAVEKFDLLHISKQTHNIYKTLLAKKGIIRSQSV